MNSRFAKIGLLTVAVALLGGARGAAAQDLEANAALVRNFYDVVFNQREVARATEFLSPDYVSHGPAHDRNVDLAATGAFLMETVTVFPDIRIEVQQTIAQGDLVTATWLATGTHSGTMMGLSATGNAVSVMGISVFRIADGKIVEGWNAYDRHDLLIQLEPSAAVPGDPPAEGTGN